MSPQLGNNSWNGIIACLLISLISLIYSCMHVIRKFTKRSMKCKLMKNPKLSCLPHMNSQDLLETHNAWGKRRSKNIESPSLTPKIIGYIFITYHGTGRLNWTIKKPTSEGLEIPPLIRVHRNHGTPWHTPPLHQSIHPHAVWLEAPPTGMLSFPMKLGLFTNKNWTLFLRGLKKLWGKSKGYDISCSNIQ